MLNTYSCFNYQTINSLDFVNKIISINESFPYLNNHFVKTFFFIITFAIFINFFFFWSINIVNNKNTTSGFNKNVWVKTALSVLSITVLLNQSNVIINTLLFILMLLVIFILLTYLFNFNNFLLNIVTGSKTGKTLFDSILFDFINLLSFKIRFLVQYVRILLISVSLVLLVEFFFQNTNISTDFGITQIIIYSVRLVFEYIDLLLITTIQFTSFNTMLFWLLNFMFSNTNNNLIENLCEDKLF